MQTRATGHKSTVRAAATVMRVKRDGGNASDVDCYGGEEVEWQIVVSVKTDETAKGKDSAASHFPRAEVEESDRPESRSNHGRPMRHRTRIDTIRKSHEQRRTHGTGQTDETGEAEVRTLGQY
jgi:hypothetical protein